MIQTHFKHVCDWLFLCV